MWERVLKIKNVAEYMVVCSLHFTRNDYILPDQCKSQRYLKRDAVPSCNLPNTAAKEKEKQLKNNARKKRDLTREEKKFQSNSESKKSDAINVEVPDQDIIDTVSTSTETSQTDKANKNPIKCTECEKTFTFKSYLDRHMYKHAEEKPHECQICHKKFAYLGRHMLVHTGERPFSCDLCGKRFISSSNLKTHYRVHVNERPYKCTICGKSFVQSGSLKKHLRVHSGDRPFGCQLCEAKFTQKENLNKHMRIHDGLRPYSCDICSETFKQVPCLKRHLTKKHKDEKK